jgi:undecaprenyl diphosphate synthase
MQKRIGHCCHAGLLLMEKGKRGSVISEMIPDRCHLETAELYCKRTGVYGMHVGIIPDGNRRWASYRHASLAQAYAIGFCRVIQVVLTLAREGIQDLTFFGLSRDNYHKRPPDQVEMLLTRIIDSMQVATHLLRAEGVQVKFVGAVADLGVTHYKQLLEIEGNTLSKCPSTNLNILVNYSPGWDLQKLGTYATIEIPNCDCIFRSGGMHRLSGFLPMQSSEAELFFSRKLWPDVQPADIHGNIYKKIHKNLGA